MPIKSIHKQSLRSLTPGFSNFLGEPRNVSLLPYVQLSPPFMAWYSGWSDGYRDLLDSQPSAAYHANPSTDSHSDTYPNFSNFLGEPQNPSLIPCIPTPAGFLSWHSKWRDGYRDWLDIKLPAAHHASSDRFFALTIGFGGERSWLYLRLFMAR
ncbi:hypothetical protein AVEN_81375-1 [Araneus ventricosus]|uniref:Uncharacterized protein n=1 Tax=Araneus ventricosus TaxID=182803 RepID=A0A4Y2B6Z4_ARAVE|nr:hypothetical protein AVEN_81375-1 [Araneus ventricosus]